MAFLPRYSCKLHPRKLLNRCRFQGIEKKKTELTLLFAFECCEINIYYLPAGRSVLRKTVPEVLSTARGRRPRAVLKTEGTVFLNTDRPRPANNIFIFFLLFFKS